MAVPTQLIDSKFARDLNQNFINLRSSILDPALGFADSDASWYSLEELQNYIDYIKEEAKTLNYEVNGIRLYLGVYPNDPIYGENSNLTTIFLSPTGYPKDGDPGKGDISQIAPMNYGTTGNPPNMEYPSI